VDKAIHNTLKVVL